MDPLHPVLPDERRDGNATSTDQSSATDRPITASSPAATMNARKPSKTAAHGTELVHLRDAINKLLGQTLPNDPAGIREREKKIAGLEGRLAQLERKIKERLEQQLTALEERADILERVLDQEEEKRYLAQRENEVLQEHYRELLAENQLLRTNLGLDPW